MPAKTKSGLIKGLLPKDYSKKYRKENPEIWQRIIEKHKPVRNRKLRKSKEEKKLEAIKYLGDKCSECKQTFHFTIYDFHHKEEFKKLKHMSQLYQSSEEVWWNEINKCILLCANCHRLLHFNERKKKRENENERHEDGPNG